MVNKQFIISLKNNSPLPSNNINDIALDFVNGVVFIATDRGLVSFDSGAHPQVLHCKTRMFTLIQLDRLLYGCRQNKN